MIEYHEIIVEVLLQVTRDGRIVDEGVVRMNAARKQHKQFSRGQLADKIVTNAVELEVR